MVAVPAGGLESGAMRFAGSCRCLARLCPLAEVPARQPAPAGFGTLSAESLRVGRLEFARVKSNLQLLPDEALLQNISFDCYKGRGSGTVSVNFGAPSVLYVAQMKVSGVDMAALLAPFPDARDKMTGKMEAQLTLSGESVHSTDPLAGKRGTGQVVIRNGRLPTLQIKKRPHRSQRRNIFDGFARRSPWG